MQPGADQELCFVAIVNGLYDASFQHPVVSHPLQADSHLVIDGFALAPATIQLKH